METNPTIKDWVVACKSMLKSLCEVLQKSIISGLHRVSQWLQGCMDFISSNGQTIQKLKGFLASMHLGRAAIVMVVGLGSLTLLSMLPFLPFCLPSRPGLRLPLGSMGWPFFGETFALRSQQQKFYMIRQRTYGELFKTHVFGYPSIVTTSPEAAKFVLVEHPHLFRRRGLPFVEDALGYRFFGYIENHRLHMKLRKQLQVPLFHLHKLIPQLEAWAISLMRSWEGRTVNALQEAKLVLHPLPSFYIT